MPGVTDVTIDTVARTVWGEARSEGINGMRAVAHVICNRAGDNRWPSDHADVCTQPSQFSCWNQDDPNRERLVGVEWTDVNFQHAYALSCTAIIPVSHGSHGNGDPTHGANHYCTAQLLEDSPPAWADLKKITARIGNHVFFRL